MVMSAAMLGEKKNQMELKAVVAKVSSISGEQAILCSSQELVAVLHSSVRDV